MATDYPPAATARLSQALSPSEGNVYETPLAITCRPQHLCRGVRAQGTAEVDATLGPVH